MEPPRVKGESLPGVKSASEWLQSLRSDEFWDQHHALERYERARDGLDLEALSGAEKAELVDLCGSRLKIEKSSIRGSQYGRLLVDVADRSSVPLFEELARSPEDHKRLYGLAGLMKFSQEKAVEAGIRMESTTFGVFTIVKAARLVGPVSVPTLRVLREKLKKRSSQSWIERALQDLR